MRAIDSGDLAVMGDVRRRAATLIRLRDLRALFPRLNDGGADRGGDLRLDRHAVEAAFIAADTVVHERVRAILGRHRNLHTPKMSGNSITAELMMLRSYR